MCIRDSQLPPRLKVAQACRQLARFALGQRLPGEFVGFVDSVSYKHLRAHETVLDLVCRLLLEKKKMNTTDERNPTSLQLETDNTTTNQQEFISEHAQQTD